MVALESVGKHPPYDCSSPWPSIVCLLMSVVPEAF